MGFMLWQLKKSEDKMKASKILRYQESGYNPNDSYLIIWESVESPVPNIKCLVVGDKQELKHLSQARGELSDELQNAYGTSIQPTDFESEYYENWDDLEGAGYFSNNNPNKLNISAYDFIRLYDSKE